MKELICEANR